jgi:FkbM family methyltransferase
MNTINKKTLANILNSFKDCFFVNIGANDGIENDPLYEFVKKNSWKGVYVEPGIESFTALKNNFNNTEGIIFENIAITDFDGEIDLFFGTTYQHFSVSEPYANWMYDVVPNKRQVPCLTPSSLLRKHNITNVDVVSIDTEGHDSVILCNFPLDTIKPKVIIAEFVHVEIAGSSVQSMQEYISSHGYRCYINEERTDIIGIREDVEFEEIFDDTNSFNSSNVSNVEENTTTQQVSVSCIPKTSNTVEGNNLKQINLQDNDGLSAYKNNACQQHHGSFNVFYEFLKQTQPTNVLEIGTALGGFTKILKEFIDELKLQCNILTYEIHDQPWYQDMRNNGIDVRVENVFTEHYVDVDQFVKEYIARPGTTIVLCDGGSKKDEFNVLSDYLKVGDFILAHDYGYDAEVFERDIKGKVWNWCEITESDIAVPCKRNNLIDYDRTTFNNVAWVCKVKAF